MKEFTITGIPEGFEPIDKDINKSIRQAKYLEYYLRGKNVHQWPLTDRSTDNYLILKKIEKSKKYRPCENELEAEPFWDKKIKFKNGSNAIYRITAIGEEDIVIGYTTYSYNNAFYMFECVDGTPFGVKVTE